MLCVGDAVKRKVMSLPLAIKAQFIFRTDRDDHGIFGRKFLEILMQLHHMRPAISSGKSSVEHEVHMFLTAKIRQ